MKSRVEMALDLIAGMEAGFAQDMEALDKHLPFKRRNSNTQRVIHSIALRMAQAIATAKEELEVIRKNEVDLPTIMQDTWNNIAEDTGCHPLDIQRYGNKLFFDPNHWAAAIALRLTERKEK